MIRLRALQELRASVRTLDPIAETLIHSTIPTGEIGHVDTIDRMAIVVGYLARCYRVRVCPRGLPCFIVDGSRLRWAVGKPDMVDYDIGVIVQNLPGEVLRRDYVQTGIGELLVVGILPTLDADA